MMAIERQGLSQLYPGIAPFKPNHRTSIPLSYVTFGTSVCYEINALSYRKLGFCLGLLFRTLSKFIRRF
jgi:hypothetical protein